MKPSRHGRAHRRTALLRDDGQERPGYGLRASKPDGSIVLDLPDGTDVHLVSLHRHRSAGLREVAEGARRAHHAGHRTGLLGGDRRCLSRRARHPGRLLHRLIDADKEYGIGYRWGYTFEDFSPAFRATPMAHFFADLFADRNVFGDVDTIITQFQAYQQPEPEGHHAKVACPAIIITGSEDNTHRTAFALQKRIAGCELKILYGAGHACQIEQPAPFNRYMIEFLTAHGLFPAAARRR